MSVNNPPSPNVSTFNNLYWITADLSLTQAAGDLRYLKFPVAQGTENLQAINVNGLASFLSSSPPTSTATQPAATDSSTKMPTTAWVQSAITAGGGGTINSLVINPSQTAPCPTAGISNPFNTGGYASQYFSNVAYTYINLWVDFQAFPSPATYQDSMMVQVDIVWDGNDASPSAQYGNCNFLCKLFPKRIFTSPQWGSHFSGVSAKTDNSYTGLASYNSINASYAPFGRQYWCYNIQGNQLCSVYGGASYCLFQFIKPTTSNYSCSTSVRVIDSSVLQNNTQVPSANSGVKVYITFEV
jgi:hypothetical protein